MGSGKKRMLTSSGEWAKHLRPFCKKMFWSSERQAERKQINEEVTQKSK